MSAWIGLAVAALTGLAGPETQAAPSAEPGAVAAAGMSPAVAVDQTLELTATRPRYALEGGMSGEVARLYAAGLAAVRANDLRTALGEIRKARARCYRELLGGPTPRRLARRHFIRIGYAEAQASELILIDEQLPRYIERPEEHATLIQLRAMLLHNLFLAVRSFTGRTDPRLAATVQMAYEKARIRPGRFKNQVQLGYAAILAERGELAQARAEFAQLAAKDVQAEGMDLAVAYFYTAVGETSRAMARIEAAAQRAGWAHPTPGRDGGTLRAQVYRMNDFDRLRSHPRFTELVTEPEEAAGL